MYFYAMVTSLFFEANSNLLTGPMPLALAKSIHQIMLNGKSEIHFANTLMIMFKSLMYWLSASITSRTTSS